MKTSLLRARPHLWYQLYWVVYLIWFFWLDLTITDPKYIIHSPVDDLIPFNEWFIFPYCSWFVLLAAVTAQYYLPRAILPHEILLCVDTGDCEELSEALTQRAGHKVWVHVPQRGEKSTLADMAVRNAQEEVRRATTAEEKTAYTLEALQKMLNLPQPPRRERCSSTGLRVSSIYSGSISRRKRLGSLRWVRPYSIRVTLLEICLLYTSPSPRDRG